MAEVARPPKAWMLRITDQVEISKRESYESAVKDAVTKLENLDIASIRYINSSRVAFGANVYEYVHHVRFDALGDYEHPTLQGSDVCEEIEGAYRRELFSKSRWEFLEIIEESALFTSS